MDTTPHTEVTLEVKSSTSTFMLALMGLAPFLVVMLAIGACLLASAIAGAS